MQIPCFKERNETSAISFLSCQVFLLFGILLSVTHLPAEYKLTAAVIAVVEAFVIFPWWFAVIHLFAVFTNEESLREELEEAGRGQGQIQGQGHSPPPFFPPSRSSREGVPYLHHEGGGAYPFPAFYVSGDKYFTMGRASTRTRMSEV